jgi:drug/metabolite transporter (DMT)-like permease
MLLLSFVIVAELLSTVIRHDEATKNFTSPQVPTSKNRLFAYCLLALSMSLVGSYVAFSKPLVSAFPVFLLAWLRFGIGGLAIPHWLKAPSSEIPMTTGTQKLVFLESFFGNFLFTICMLFGMSMTSAVNAGVIMASIPAAIALMSWLFLGEKVSRRSSLSILVVAVGALLFSMSSAAPSPEELTPSESGQSSANSFWGNWLIFGAVLCEAAYAVIGKKLTASLSPKRITALINLWGFILMTPMGVYAAWSFDFSSVSVDIWCLLTFYAIAASIGSVWLWMTGLKNVPASKAGIFTVMLPLSTASVGVLFLGETLSGVQTIAFIICLLGVVLATYSGDEYAGVKKRS